jgi:predicted transcriptional regulator
MAEQSPYEELTRRERQIMDILYRLGEASAEDVRSRLSDPPSYSAARAMLAKLEEKRHVTHVERDLRYIYLPTVPREEVRRSALSRVVQTFFDGSVSQAVTGLLSQSVEELPAEELERLAALIEDARGRKGERS